MITDEKQQNEALETIMQGGTPDIPKTVNVPLSYERGGEAYEDPEKDEDGNPITYIDDNGVERYKLEKLNTTAGTILPTIGIMIEI